jgi:adenine-specific DNA-methyltransferase
MDTSRPPEDWLDSIALGDCLPFLKLLPDSSLDLVVSSPPYNIGKEYEKRQALQAYLDEQTAVLRECHRVLRASGSIFWQVGSYVDDGRHIPLDVRVFPILESFGMVPRNRIVWVRPHGLHARNRLSCRHETVLWFTKGEHYKFFLDPIRIPQKYPNKTSWRAHNKGELTSNPLGKNPGDVWAFQNVKHNHEEQTIHPAQFPEDMIQRIVLASTEPGDVILDPYMGVGTVAVVARDLDRHFTGTELDPSYHAIALHRLSGEPDANANFPNLKTLRQYAERNGLEDLSRFTFTVQVGRTATPGDRARIFPEPEHLEALEEDLKVESEQSAYARGLVGKDGKGPKVSRRARPSQMPLIDLGLGANLDPAT